MGCSGSKQGVSSEAIALTPQPKVLNKDTKEGEYPEANAAPEPQPDKNEFRVVIERAAVKADDVSQTLGFERAVIDNALQVTFVEKKGLIPSWNAKNMNEPDSQVKVGDLIVEVNGIAGVTDQMSARLSDYFLCMVLNRPTEAQLEEARTTERDIIATRFMEVQAKAAAVAAKKKAQLQSANESEVQIEPQPQDEQHQMIECEPEWAEPRQESEKKSCAWCTIFS